MEEKNKSNKLTIKFSRESNRDNYFVHNRCNIAKN